MPQNAVYLNNAATTWPKPERVAKAMAAFLEGRGANLARGSASERDLGTLDMVTTCRQAIASLFGGPGADPRNVTFTANVTESLNIVLKGFLEPGMRAATTSMEHNAVMRPLRRLEARGVRLTVMPCSPEGVLEETTLAQALEEGLDLLVQPLVLVAPRLQDRSLGPDPRADDVPVERVQGPDDQVVVPFEVTGSPPDPVAVGRRRLLCRRVRHGHPVPGESVVRPGVVVSAER